MVCVSGAVGVTEPQASKKLKPIAEQINLVQVQFAEKPATPCLPVRSAGNALRCKVVSQGSETGSKYEGRVTRGFPSWLGKSKSKGKCEEPIPLTTSESAELNFVLFLVPPGSQYSEFKIPNRDQGFRIGNPEFRPPIKYSGSRIPSHLPPTTYLNLPSTVHRLPHPSLTAIGPCVTLN